MSDLNLADCRVTVGYESTPRGSKRKDRPMTSADVVELARQLPGAEVRWLCEHGYSAWNCQAHKSGQFKADLDHSGCAEVLVLPLDGEKE